MRKTAVLALTAVLVVAASPAAMAWSALGHRLVGELAERHLDPVAGAQVKLLLAGEPDPTLAGVADWADRLRDLDPAEFKATSRWHYINATDQSCRFEPARDCPDGNCVTGAIERQRAILADRSQPLPVRRDALKFIVHFVGDVHQPMHANSHDDLGGNKYQISLRTDLAPEAYARNRYVDGVMGTNLHSVWDYYILGSAKLSLRQYAARLDALPWPPMPADGPATGPMAWAAESCRLVDARHLYPQGHKLDIAYLDAYRPLAEQRVRQAAWRLAQVLDATLGD
ncbi:S1/P1 nuclease [Luteimonas sp. 50]|uniref:S1/P1 nuclease n=1 Tax=Cognatiluteimonas sedimenti TaxID=2927791 RepID=A0ABT0A3G1_9GAMM|nr:S1/P1 nuclease [Lysobacter sedimenti]MCJ0825512.1 S1/P1 nuclease [Lysobacter sedimenti]